MTGNIEKDIGTVKALLEELQVLNPKYITRDVKHFPPGNPKIARFTHEVAYKKEIIRAIVEMNVETGEKFLQNAFVLNPKVIP